MKSILYCIADQDRVRLFMIRGTLPGIVYTLGLQARTRVTRLIFAPRVCHLKKRTFNSSRRCVFYVSSSLYFFFFFAKIVPVEDQFVSGFFVRNVDEERVVFFFFMKFRMKHIEVE